MDFIYYIHILSYNLDVHFLQIFTRLAKTNITIAHSPGFFLSSARVCVENQQPVPSIWSDNVSI